jgi:aminopeptidase N
VVSLDPSDETATLTPDEPLPAGISDVRIRFSGTLNEKLRGFYLTKSDKRSYAVTQFESTDARRAFPNFDEPAYKATFAITMTIDQGDMAISNGRVLSDTPGPARGQHTVKFSTSPKMSSYLVALAVGDFECLGGAADGTPIRVCTVPGKQALGQIALESTQEILKYYNGYFAIKYPFGKLDMLAVPDFAASAMENTAAIFYRERSLLADTATATTSTRKSIARTIAHEVAHQWFGDLVTMQWWDDLWLNEGFATWMETRPMAATHPEWNTAVDEARETRAALNVDSLRTTRPIHMAVRTPDEIESLFDTISYNKGGAVLRMIEHYVGAAAFREGINAYLDAHAYGNATSEDFWKVIASTSGKPVDRILHTFINQPGAPVVSVAAKACTPDGRTHVTFSQERFMLQPGAGRTDSTWEVPACLKTGAPEESRACVVVSAPQAAVDVGAGCAPWIFANAGAEGYFRTAYAPELLRALAPHLGEALTAPERFALVDDEWALVRANRHTAAEYLTLAAGFGHESSSEVMRELTGRLRFVREYLTADTSRRRFEAFVQGVLRPLFSQIGFPGSAGDTDDRRALRAVVVDALGRTGNDPDVVRQARSALDRILTGTGPAIDPALKDVVLQIAAEHGDDNLYRALTAAAVRAPAANERSAYLFASAQFRDEGVVDRALRRTLSNDIRTQDAGRYLAAFFANPVARPRAWAFLKTNWAEVEPRLRMSNSIGLVTRALGAFCDGASREDIRSFFAARRLPGSGAALNQAIDRINNCIDLQVRQTKPVAEWLAGR